MVIVVILFCLEIRLGKLQQSHAINIPMILQFFFPELQRSMSQTISQLTWPEGEGSSPRFHLLRAGLSLALTSVHYSVLGFQTKIANKPVSLS